MGSSMMTMKSFIARHCLHHLHHHLYLLLHHHHRVIMASHQCLKPVVPTMEVSRNMHQWPTVTMLQSEKFVRETVNALQKLTLTTVKTMISISKHPYRQSWVVKLSKLLDIEQISQLQQIDTVSSALSLTV